MKRWCALTHEAIIQPGHFVEASLYNLSGRSHERDIAFMQALAERLMRRYEGDPNPSLLILDHDLVDERARTKDYYRRLFDKQGQYTPEFVSWVGEVLAHWIEESLEVVYYASGNGPHGSEPAFDVVVLVWDDSWTMRVRLVQVKVTRDRLGANCNEALDGFQDMEERKHLPDLMARLRLLKDSARLPAEVEPGDLVFDAQRRHYRVTAIHGEDRQTQRIMTAFADKVPGGIQRRSTRLVHLSEWDTFWDTLAEMVHDQLT